MNIIRKFLGPKSKYDKSLPYTHSALGTWNSKEWKRLIQPTVTDEQARLVYD